MILEGVITSFLFARLYLPNRNDKINLGGVSNFRKNEREKQRKYRILN
jgi:hypothetical protein